MKQKMTTKHKFMAYLLNKDMGYSMTSIAKLMKVSQSTISTSIQCVEYMRKIYNLEKELFEAKQSLIKLGYIEPKILPPNNDEII